MKKTFTFIFLLFSSIVLFTACEKDKGTDYGDPKTEGRLQFVNNSSNGYSIYVDGSNYGTCPGKKYKYVTVAAGYHSFEVSQNEGYILYPTVQTGNVYVSSGETMVVSFP